MICERCTNKDDCKFKTDSIYACENFDPTVKTQSVSLIDGHIDDTDKKLTDLEIIKALECCIQSSHFGECFENKCPLVSEKGCKVGKETLYPYALDLINRLQAENERLKKGWKADVILTANVKAEVYKEFAEELKKRSIGIRSNFDFKSDIDNLLKEMVGEDNA